MPYYKNTNNGVYFLDDAAFENLLPAGCTQITNEEAHILTTPSELTPKEQIAVLENKITNRRMRESLAGIDNGWLANIHAEIAALRAQL